MSDHLPDTWASRDLPVLREIVARLSSDPTTTVRTQSVAAALQMDYAEARSSVVNLIRGGYVYESTGTQRQGARRGDTVVDVSEQALRASGAWPSPETALERMVAALEVIARDAAHPAKTQAGDALAAFRSAGQAFRAVAAAGLSGEMP